MDMPPAAPSPHWPHWPHWIWGGVWLLLGWAVAFWLRHGLVEPALLTARCDAVVWALVDWSRWADWDAACLLRTLTVQAFVNHRLANVALALAVLALLLPGRWLAGAALLAGAAGLVLYSTDRAALAVLLAGWAWVSPPRPRPHAPPT
jgi:hypothetical protein